jgi:hypothetical protein
MTPAQINHALQRAAQRYGLLLTPEDLETAKEQIRSQQAVHVQTISRTRTLFDVTLHGRTLRALYVKNEEEKDGEVHTFFKMPYDPENIHATSTQRTAAGDEDSSLSPWPVGSPAKRKDTPDPKPDLRLKRRAARARRMERALYDAYDLSGP